MSNAQQISDLLKVAKDIPILHTGINDTATEYSTYPVKEHNRLLSTSGKPMSTPLNSLLSMRNVKIFVYCSLVVTVCAAAPLYCSV